MRLTTLVSTSKSVVEKRAAEVDELPRAGTATMKGSVWMEPYARSRVPPWLYCMTRQGWEHHQRWAAPLLSERTSRNCPGCRPLPGHVRAPPGPPSEHEAPPYDVTTLGELALLS